MGGLGGQRGNKVFELSNHLCNVLVTVSDRKLQVSDNGQPAAVSYYLADVMSANDYYPFGMMMPGRKYSSDGYRYGFNGKEKDKDISSECFDFGARTYDSRVARFLSTDRLISISPFYSSYIFAGNKPISAIDYNGDVEIVINYITKDKDGTITTTTNRMIIETVEDIRGIHRSPYVININRSIETVSYTFGNMTTYYEAPVTKSIEIQKGTGLTPEQQTWDDDSFDDQLAKLLYKGSRAINPFHKGYDAIANERDVVTGEYRHPAKKYLKLIESGLDIVTLGKGSAGRKGLEKLGKSFAKKLLDFGMEEIITFASKSIGLDDDKTAILGYHLVRFAYEGKNGAYKDILKLLQTIAKGGDKLNEAIRQLRDYGAPVDMPKDGRTAVDQALNAVGQNSKLLDKK